jgi:hypothetical protein
MAKKFFIILAVILSFALTVYAGENKNEVWSPVTPGPFTTFTAPVIDEGKFSIQPFYFFNIARGIFSGDRHYSSLPSKNYKYNEQIQLYTSYGLMKCVEVNVQPLWQMNNIKVGDKSAESAAFGDFLMNVRYCGIDESYWYPRITGLFQVKLPTGKYQKADPSKLGGDIIGTGSTDYTYGLSFTKGIKPVLWHLDLLYTNSPRPVRIDGIKTIFDDTYTVNGAFEWMITEKIDIMSEFSWNTQGDRKLDGNWTADTGKSSLIWAIGIGYSEKDWQVLVGYLRTLLGENIDANDSIGATVTITF